MSQTIQTQGLQLLEQLQTLLASVEQRVLEREMPGETGMRSNVSTGVVEQPVRSDSALALTQRIQTLRDAQTEAEKKVAAAETELGELEVALRELLNTVEATARRGA